jgi:hypothetical protein
MTTAPAGHDTLRCMWRTLTRGGAALVIGAALAAPAHDPTPAPRWDLPGYATSAAMRASGAPYAGWAAAGRRFVAFDPRGDGLAVELVGDLATADRVAILVPGVGGTLADFDRGLGGVRRRAPSVQARVLSAELHAVDARARVAVVAWLGYDPPEGLGVDAARRERAGAGARALTGFVATLVADRPGLAVTLVGHSYGALVLGLAAPHLDPRVGDLVALAGSGMGVDRAADLRTGARVWAAEASRDWIRRVPGLRVGGLGHGTRPGDPAFGARPLPVAGVDGHDGYLVPGSPTLHAVALIVLGHPAEVPS